MSCGHEISAAVLASPHQVADGFLGRGGNRHRGDLPQMQQPGQMRGIADIGLDPVPGRTDQLRWRGHLTTDASRGQRSGQPEPRRAGLVGHRHRARQIPEPGQRSRHDPASTAARSTSPVSPSRPHANHRTCVHIQPDTRTLNTSLGPPTSCGSTGQDLIPRRQPTFTCEWGPAQPLIPTCVMSSKVIAVCSHDYRAPIRDRSPHTCRPCTVWVDS